MKINISTDNISFTILTRRDTNSKKNSDSINCHARAQIREKRETEPCLAVGGYSLNNLSSCLTKKWIKLARFGPTYQAVDFILKYTTKNRCDNARSSISVGKQKTNVKRF